MALRTNRARAATTFTMTGLAAGARELAPEMVHADGRENGLIYRCAHCLAAARFANLRR